MSVRECCRGGRSKSTRIRRELADSYLIRPRAISEDRRPSPSDYQHLSGINLANEFSAQVVQGATLRGDYPSVCRACPRHNGLIPWGSLAADECTVLASAPPGSRLPPVASHALEELAPPKHEPGRIDQHPGDDLRCPWWKRRSSPTPACNCSLQPQRIYDVAVVCQCDRLPASSLDQQGLCIAAARWSRWSSTACARWRVHPSAAGKSVSLNTWETSPISACTCDLTSPSNGGDAGAFLAAVLQGEETEES